MSAKKARLGQNFLVDRGAAAKIVAALGDVSQRTVMEIGPGKGVLTEPLLRSAQHVIAVELDRVLAAELRQKFGDPQASIGSSDIAMVGPPKLEVLEGDVLSVDFEAVLQGMSRPQGGGPSGSDRACVLGNLPYYITSDILLRIFEFHRLFDLVVIMVQREVAERIVALPGTRDFGLLSATAQIYARVEKLFTLPPGAFKPPPKVYSSVLRLKLAPRFDELGVPAEGFIAFLKLAFAMKRKTLLNNLKKSYREEDIKAALNHIGLRPDIRAEAIPLEKSAAVFRVLQLGLDKSKF
ncbi:MAG TPA: 16S rRNA (adenine(1518)-N(6)/adenine(1519)-N(6))-dimethyltransferase RsmA [Candidatus Angelobacter sp.]|nr:16S rRNA (adenine(1518)-N(6)/adenine(1519)-N(6))-dimethyltransferase RsmA [Candidatus Angelobacter sp.]